MKRASGSSPKRTSNGGAHNITNVIAGVSGDLPFATADESVSTSHRPAVWRLRMVRRKCVPRFVVPELDCDCARKKEQKHGRPRRVVLGQVLEVRLTMSTLLKIDRSEETSGMRVAPRETYGIRQILVCLDQSPLSEVCLPYAAFMSRTFGSHITLLHVMQLPRERAGARATDALGCERCEKEISQASGDMVSTRLEQGHAAERIRAVAHEVQADLVVLGTYGEGGVTEWSLGSTTQQVLSLVQGPVLIARSDSAPLKAFSPQHILVPLDGSLRTESTLPIAVRIAKSNGASILLAHVVPELFPSGAHRVAEDEEVEMAHELARRLESRANTYLGRLQSNLAPEVRSVRTTVIRSTDPCQSPSNSPIPSASTWSCSPRTDRPATASARLEG